MKERSFGVYRAVFTQEGEQVIICPTYQSDVIKPHQAEIIIEDLKSCLLWLRDKAKQAREEQTPELFH